MLQKYILGRQPLKSSLEFIFLFFYLVPTKIYQLGHILTFYSLP